MNIYPSTKVKPYVYMGIHKVTGEIYIGYRERNIILNKLSHIDLFEYKTSSKVVRPIFEQMIWTILAEFENGNDAYDFEQQLIYENWDNSLLLNRFCHYGKARFKKSGTQSEATRKKKSIALKNKPWSNRRRVAQTEEVSAKKSKAMTNKKLKSYIRLKGQGKGIPKSAEANKKNSDSHLGVLQAKITCPYCQKIGGNIMRRYHFENCKLK